MTPDLFSPKKIHRGATGEFWHPDLPRGCEGRAVAGPLSAMGFNGLWVYGGNAQFPDEVAMQGGDVYWRALQNWQPEPPKQPSRAPWRLAAILDTEDGPAALFVSRRATQ